METEENGPSPNKRARVSDDFSCTEMEGKTTSDVRLMSSADIMDNGGDMTVPCGSSHSEKDDDALRSKEQLMLQGSNETSHYAEGLRKLSSDEENFNRFLKEELQRVAAENAARNEDLEDESTSGDNYEKQQSPVKNMKKESLECSSREEERLRDGSIVISVPPCTPANSPEVTGGCDEATRSPSTPMKVGQMCHVTLSPGYQLLSPQSQAHVESVVLASSPTEPAATLPGVQTLISNRSHDLTSSAQQVVYTSDLSTLRAVASIPMPSPGSSNSSGDEDWDTELSPTVIQQIAMPQQHGSSQFLATSYPQVIQTAPLVHMVQQPYQSLITGHHQILNWQTATQQPIMVSTPVTKKMVTAQTSMPCASQNLSAYNAQLKKPVYHGTPHPVLTGRTVTPNALPVSSSAFRQMSSGKMHMSSHHCSFTTPGSSRSMNTPLCHLSQLSLNSSGSEEERSPPEQHSFRVTSVPYNTPVSGPASSNKIPSAADLQAALLRTRREPIDPSEMGAGREQHNAKERARRARIKGACDNLREMMPGNMVRTDKATLMELAVEYIKHLRTIVGEAYDRDFLKKTTPYLNMELE